jgi:hypothetical protein
LATESIAFAIKVNVSGTRLRALAEGFSDMLRRSMKIYAWGKANSLDLLFFRAYNPISLVKTSFL